MKMGIPKGALPLWWGFGGVPHLPSISPQEWGAGGLKQLFSVEYFTPIYMGTTKHKNNPVYITISLPGRMKGQILHFVQNDIFKGILKVLKDTDLYNQVLVASQCFAASDLATNSSAAELRQ